MEPKHICQVLQAATMLDYKYMGDVHALLRAVREKRRDTKMDPIELQEVLISCSRKVQLIRCVDL